MPISQGISGEHSNGYVLQDGKLVDYTRVDPSVPWGGGAMISDLYDMKSWAKALISGSLLDKQMHAEKMKTVDTGGGMKYGLGIADTGGFWGHDGSIFGFNSVFLRNQDLDASFVVFTNNCDPPGQGYIR